MFIKTLRNSSSSVAKRFYASQGSVRKNIERAFGVLVERFHILKEPCLLRDRTAMASIMGAFIIMHNMVVKSMRDEYESEHYNDSASFQVRSLRQPSNVSVARAAVAWAFWQRSGYYGVESMGEHR